jgi:hypothetical protein
MPFATQPVAKEGKGEGGDSADSEPCHIALHGRHCASPGVLKFVFVLQPAAGTILADIRDQRCK